MGSDQYRKPSKIFCVLCETAEENKITGALSSKDDISAHQNCLLFASGIYCKNSPTYDDLFGFDVSDVKQEVRRGKKLVCHLCRKRGATAGCDLTRCKRSYHYPCAREDQAKVVEDSVKGCYVLYCEKHDPELKNNDSINVPSTSGLNLSKKRESSDSHRPKPDRRESSSSTGSSEVGTFYSQKRASPEIISFSDFVRQNSVNNSDNSTPPKQNSKTKPAKKQLRSAPAANDSRTGGELNSSSTGVVSTSQVNNGDGPKNNPKQLNNKQMELDSQESSPETPRRKKKKTSLVISSDDELQTNTDPVLFPVVLLKRGLASPAQHNHSTPVAEKTRPSKELGPLTTEDDDDDTEIESDVSPSLLLPKPYSVTVPCTVIVDSGPSIESENSLELGLNRETSTTNITDPEPPATTKNPDARSSTNPASQRNNSKNGSVDQPESPDRSSRTSAAVTSLLASPIPDQPKEVSKSSAAMFWTRCNEAGCTEEIFTELMGQLSSLGEQILTQQASQQDFDIALKILEASGRLPTIITQLEKDLDEQEKELDKKKAALRGARAALGIKPKRS